MKGPVHTNLPHPTVPLLYVDDNEPDRLLVKLAMQHTPTAFKLYIADGADSAAPYFESRLQNQAVNAFPRPALILLDYAMGARTGADFLFWLRVIRHITDIPVIMFSGSVGTRHVAECYNAGADHFLHKPIGLPATQAIIRVLYFCMSFNPPRFGALTRLSEFQPDPRGQLSDALAA